MPSSIWLSASSLPEAEVPEGKVPRMSTPFRVFLLILAAAGVLWAYRARSTDIRHWLRTGPPVIVEKGGDLMSPVNRLVDPDATCAKVWLQGKDAPRQRAQDPEPSEPDPIYEPTPEDELLAADMPAVDGFAGEGAAATEEAGAGNPPPGPGDGAPGIVVNEPAPAPEPPALEAYEEITHVLESGESLWSVAARYLGSGVRYKEIQELNRDAIPDGGDVIPAGTRLRIRISSRERVSVGTSGVGADRRTPAVSEARETRGGASSTPGELIAPAGFRNRNEKGLKPGPRENDTSVEEKSGPRPPAGVAKTGGLLHTVRKDENLQRIARKYFPDDRDGWRVLYDANQDALPSPDRIRVGQVLRIPSHPR